MLKLKEILVEKGLTQRELAKEVGMSYQMLCLFITGKADLRTRQTLKIAKYLNVSVEELMEEEKEWQK